MKWLVAQYLITVFGISCTLLQAVFAHRRIEGLRFFRNALHSYLFSAIIGVGLLVWFYVTQGEPETHYASSITDPVIEGSEQTGMFVLAVGAAIVFTAALSSVLNRTRLADPPGDNPPLNDATTGSRSGLDELKKMTYWQYLRRPQRKASKGSGLDQR